MKHTQETYWIWLNSIEGMDVTSFYALIAEYTDAKTVFEADDIDEKMLKLSPNLRRSIMGSQTENAIELALSKIKRHNIVAVTRLSPEYPISLQNIELPPPVLYVRGELINEEKALTVIGSRKPTRYGLDAAYMIGRDCGKEGITVVSGLARGIDVRAHQGAIESNGRIVAVLGCGIDVVYPREHEKMYDIVAERGCLISEFSIGTRPLKTNFPLRNRIMSGLSKATVVVEAGYKSGALITANHALSQGKDVFAVPGSIFASECKGSNMLLRDGAAPLLSVSDVVESYGWQNDTKRAELIMDEQEKIKEPDDPVQRRIFDLLSDTPVSFDSLTETLEIEAGDLNSVLTIMELNGIITQLPGRLFLLRRV